MDNTYDTRNNALGKTVSSINGNNRTIDCIAIILHHYKTPALYHHYQHFHYHFSNITITTISFTKPCCHPLAAPTTNHSQPHTRSHSPHEDTPSFSDAPHMHMLGRATPALDEGGHLSTVACRVQRIDAHSLAALSFSSECVCGGVLCFDACCVLLRVVL